jgi:chromosome segregation ATPase
MTQKNSTETGPTSKRDTTALALLGAMFVALAMVGSASLSAIGPNIFQEIGDFVGIGRTSSIQAEQARQAAAIKALGQMVQTVSTDLNTVTSRIKATENNEMASSDRFALVDADLAALVTEVRAIRTSRSDAADSIQEPMDRLDLSMEANRAEIASLRSSFDEHDQAYRKEFSSVNKRLDRLEQLVSRDLTASVRTVARKKQQVRRRARPETMRSQTENANMTMWGNPAGPTTYAPYAQR